MIRIRSHLLLVVLACLLTGCAMTSGRPPEALFLLSQPEQVGSPEARAATHRAAANQHTLLLAGVTLASYLTREGIVYQTAPRRIVIADNNRWAAPLAAQIQRGLYQALNHGLPKLDVRRPGAPVTLPADYRLAVYIRQFQGRYDGKAIISGSWRLSSGNKHKIIGRGDFQQETLLRQDGYPALVRALSRGWQQVKADLKAAIGRILARRAQG